MPKLLDQSEVHLEFSDLARRVVHPRDLDSKRTSGVHLSGILKYVATELKLLESGQVDKEDLGGDVMPLRMGLGMASEDFMASFYPTLHWQPGEMERDGVICTPDGIRCGNAVDDRMMFVEFKGTWKTANQEKRPFMKEWMWLKQGLGEAAISVACMDEPIRLVEYQVMYWAGDYKFPLTQRWMKYLVEWSMDEIETNWQMMLKYKHRAIAEVH